MSASRNPFLRWPAACLLACLLPALLLWRDLASYAVDTGAQSLLDGDARSGATYEIIDRSLPGEEALLVDIEMAGGPEGVYTNAGLALIREVGEAFRRQPGVVGVKSITHSAVPVFRGLSFTFEPLVPGRELAPAELERLRSFATTHPLVRGLLASGDGRHAVVVVSYAADLITPAVRAGFRGRVEAVIASFAGRGAAFEIIALPLVQDEVQRTVAADLRRYGLAAAAFVVLVLGVFYRSFRTVRFIVWCELVLASLLPGAAALTGVTYNAFTAALFPMLLGVQLTFLAHLCSAFQDGMRAGAGAAETAAAALRRVFRPSLFAALTTAVGFASLWVAGPGVGQARATAVLGAGGVALAFGLTFGPGLSLLVLMHRGSGGGPGRRGGRGTAVRVPAGARLARWLRRRRGRVFGAAGLVLALGLPGLAALRTDIRIVRTLGPESPARRAAEHFEEAYGGWTFFQVAVDSGREGGVVDLPFLRYLERVRRFAELQSGVTAVYDYASVIAMINEVKEGWAPGANRLPEAEWLLGLYHLGVVSQLGDMPMGAALADPSWRSANLWVRMRDLPSEDYLAAAASIMAFAERVRPEGVSVEREAGLQTLLEADRRISRGQWRSAALSLAAIVLFLTLLWRSLPLALLAAAVAAFPAALALGLAGYAGVPVNAITLMVAAVALGITADDAVHVISTWREARAGRAPPRPAGWDGGAASVDAVEATFAAKAPPVLCTSVLLAGLFALFALTSFPPVVHFGWIGAGAFAAALAAVLLVLPAALPGR